MNHTAKAVALEAMAAGDRAALRHIGRRGRYIEAAANLDDWAARTGRAAALQWIARERLDADVLAKTPLPGVVERDGALVGWPWLKQQLHSTDTTSLNWNRFFFFSENGLDLTLSTFRECSLVAMQTLQRQGRLTPRMRAAAIAAAESAKALRWLAPQAEEAAKVLKTKHCVGMLEWLADRGVALGAVEGVELVPRVVLASRTEEECLAALSWLAERGWAELADCLKEGGGAIIAAAERGMVKVLQWLLERGVPSSALRERKVIYGAASAAGEARLAVLRWLAAQLGDDFAGCAGGVSVFTAAANHVPTLHWLAEQGLATPNACRQACTQMLYAAGQDDEPAVLEWLRPRCAHFDLACDGAQLPMLAVCNGSVEVVDWLARNGLMPPQLCGELIANARGAVMLDRLVAHGATAEDLRKGMTFGNTALTLEHLRWLAKKLGPAEALAIFRAKAQSLPWYSPNAQAVNRAQLLNWLADHGGLADAIAMSDVKFLTCLGVRERLDLLDWLDDRGAIAHCGGPLTLREDTRITADCGCSGHCASGLFAACSLHCMPEALDWLARWGYVEPGHIAVAKLAANLDPSLQAWLQQRK